MTTSTQPGWYDDPEDANAQRYWDGQNWTPHRQRKPVLRQSSAPNLPPPPPAQSSAPNFPPPPPTYPSNAASQPPPNFPPPPPTYASNAASQPPPNQPAPWLPPGQQPAGPPPQRSSNPMVVIGVIAALVVLAVGGFFGYEHFFKRPPASPEDQIRTVVQRETDEFNKGNFSYNPQLQCKANAGNNDSEIKKGRNLIAQIGPMSASVANIHVTGDKATGDITVRFQKLPDKSDTINAQFVKEDGSWKDCTPSDSSDDDDQGN
jgi:hypothetical protein